MARLTGGSSDGPMVSASAPAAAALDAEEARAPLASPTDENVNDLNVQNQHSKLIQSDTHSTTVSDKSGLNSSGIIVTEKSNNSNLLEEIPSTKLSGISQDRGFSNLSAIHLTSVHSRQSPRLTRPLLITTEDGSLINTMESNNPHSEALGEGVEVNVCTIEPNPSIVNQKNEQPSVEYDGDNSPGSSKFVREDSINMDIDEAPHFDKDSFREQDFATEVMEVSQVYYINN